MTEEFLFALALSATVATSGFPVLFRNTSASDQSVHLFFIQNIRASRHKLGVRVERLLNSAYYAYPLFLHWCLSFLSVKHIAFIARALNPFMNIMLLLAFYAAAKLTLPAEFPAGWASLALALTPQFYHLTNSRNTGLSSRSVGIFLFFLFSQFSLSAFSNGWNWQLAASAVITGYLILGFSKFAIQAVTICGLVMAVFFQQFAFLILFVLALLVFLALHPAYSTGFLKHYGIYLNFYRKELAANFILKHRYSIWRDLIYDIPLNVSRSFLKGVNYAYSNPALIVVFLNPLFVYAVFSGFSQPPADGWLKSQWQLSVAGMIAFLLTSIRATRFLGEPERYVEIVTPFAVAVAAAYLSQFDVPMLMNGIAVCFAFLVLAQVVMFFINSRKTASSQEDLLESVIRLVQAEAQPETIRFASNNENFTKILMKEPWSFVKFWSAVQTYGGLPFKEAFPVYPNVSRPAFENILREFKVNYCLLDKKVFMDIFTANTENECRLNVLLDNENVRLYNIKWL